MSMNAFRSLPACKTRGIAGEMMRKTRSIGYDVSEVRYFDISELSIRDICRPDLILGGSGALVRWRYAAEKNNVLPGSRI